MDLMPEERAKIVYDKVEKSEDNTYLPDYEMALKSYFMDILEMDENARRKKRMPKDKKDNGTKRKENHTKRTFSNPFVSSTYLLKKMRQQAARRPNYVKSSMTTKTTAIKFYNLRKRPGKRQRKLVTPKPMTTKLCRTVLKTRLRNNKLCNRKLPCPYHTVE